MSGVKMITGGQVSVATAGTEVPLSASAIDRVLKVYISAATANTGNIVVGGNPVTMTTGMLAIKGGEPVVIYADGNYIDLQSIYVDAGTNGDKAQFSYLQRT